MVIFMNSLQKVCKIRHMGNVCLPTFSRLTFMNSLHGVWKIFAYVSTFPMPIFINSLHEICKMGAYGKVPSLCLRALF